MRKFSCTSKILLVPLLACILASFYAVLGPGGSPDRIGSAIVLMFGIVFGLMSWTASLVLAILSFRAREIGAGLTLTHNLLALPAAVVCFGLAMELGVR